MSTSEPVFIAISRGDRLGFSRAFCQRYELARYSYVHLYFDRARRRIALRFSNDRTRSGRFALVRLRTGQVQTTARGFFKRFDIDPAEHAGRYTVERHRSRSLGIGEADDSFVIELTEER